MARRNSWLLWLTVVAPILREVVIYTVGFVTPGHAFDRDFISELGALEAPYALLMNTLGIGLIGFLMVFASVGLYPCFERTPGAASAMGLLAISGAFFVLVALFPCNPGCSTGEFGIRMKIHMIAGFVAMGAAVLAPTVLGLFGIFRRTMTPIHWASIILGFIGVAGYLVLLTMTTSLRYPGLIQRIVQASADLWILFAAVWCLSHERRHA